MSKSFILPVRLFVLYTMLMTATITLSAQDNNLDSFSIQYFFSDSYHDNKIRKKPSIYSNVELNFNGTLRYNTDGTAKAFVTLVSSVFDIRDEYIRLGNWGHKKFKFNSGDPKHQRKLFVRYMMKLHNNPFHVLLSATGGILNGSEIVVSDPYFMDTLSRTFTGSEWVQKAILSTKFAMANIVGTIVRVKNLKEISTQDTVVFASSSFIPVKDTVFHYVGKSSLFGKRKLQEHQMSFKNTSEVQNDTVVCTARYTDSMLLRHSRKHYFESKLSFLGEFISFVIDNADTGDFTVDTSRRLQRFQNAKTNLLIFDDEKAISLEGESALIKWIQKSSY